MPAAVSSSTSRASTLANDENLPLSEKRQESRSPHPYHRCKADTPERVQANGQNLSPPLNISSNDTVNEYNRTTFYGSDKRKRRKISTSPSDSGTEADDESTSLLRGLPAPAARPRKGLKDTKLLGVEHTPSPLLTPSYLDHDRQRVPVLYSRKQQENSQSQSGTDDETQQVRLKLARRRRAEVFRRVIETVLLCLLGIVVYTNNEVNITASHWDRGRISIQRVSFDEG